jgi:hypothetical protein
MKRIALALALMFVYTAVAHAQTQVNMTVSPVNCGRASTPLYCYGIPVTTPNGSTGQVWLDIYPNNTGFVAFINVPAFQGAAQITGATRTFNSIGQVTSIQVAFAGASDPDGDGDSDPFTGSLTLNFAYYYSAGGGGRGGAGAGWRFTVTSGSVTIATE